MPRPASASGSIPAFSNRHGAPARHFHGVAVTYAQVAVKAAAAPALTFEDAARS